MGLFQCAVPNLLIIMSVGVFALSAADKIVYHIRVAYLKYQKLEAG